jgi:tripartite-type tricarboxylate transporter receptor subunit TctC
VTPDPWDLHMTKLSRRRFMHFAAAAAGLPTIATSAWAQTYPSRPVRVIVGQAAGSGSDTVARLIGQYLSERLGQQFVVENRPGAAGKHRRRSRRASLGRWVHSPAC